MEVKKKGFKEMLPGMEVQICLIVAKFINYFISKVERGEKYWNKIMGCIELDIL